MLVRWFRGSVSCEAASLHPHLLTPQTVGLLDCGRGRGGVSVPDRAGVKQHVCQFNVASFFHIDLFNVLYSSMV